MILKGEAFSRRLESFSDDTMRLIMSMMTTKEMFYKINPIVQDSNNTEEQVVEELLRLKQSISTTTEAPK